MTPPLACPVRGCAQPLVRNGRALVCPQGHTHDVARSGYVNLLQPQDRRAASPGDSRDAVQARARLTQAGVGSALTASLLERLAPRIHGTSSTVVAELGAGAGDLLAAVAGRFAIPAVGIDLSAAAMDIAARRFAGATWVVANADRRLPLLDGTIDVLLSVHARRNPPEAARVLAPHGVFAVAVPAHDDLAELRELLHGNATARDRMEGVVAEHSAHFDIVEQWAVRDRRPLTAPIVSDLLLTTYRGQRRAAASRVDSVEGLEVTLASDVVLFSKRN